MMTTTPSFFLLSSERDEGDDDSGGAWTQVRSKKVQKKRSTKRRSEGVSSSSSSSSSSSNNRRLSSGSSKSKSSARSGPLRTKRSPDRAHPSTGSSEGQGIKWRVPNSRSGKSSAGKGPAASPPQQPEGSGKVRNDGKAAGSMSASSLGSQTGELPKFYDSSIQSKVDENEREKIRLKIWNILFRNVNRTIDELYYMCEFDSSEDQCDLAAELLATYLTDFNDLKERIQTQNKFAPRQESRSGADAEKSNVGTSKAGTLSDAAGMDDRARGGEDSAKREVSTSKGLAWEVRKSNASPSPVTLLFGARLREDGAQQHHVLHQMNQELEQQQQQQQQKQPGPTSSARSLLQRRASAMANLSLSASLANQDPRDFDGRAQQPPRSLPNSAWVRKPKIVSEQFSPSRRFSTVSQQQHRQQQQLQQHYKQHKQQRQHAKQHQQKKRQQQHRGQHGSQQRPARASAPSSSASSTSLQPGKAVVLKWQKPAKESRLLNKHRGSKSRTRSSSGGLPPSSASASSKAAKAASDGLDADDRHEDELLGGESAGPETDSPGTPISSTSGSGETNSRSLNQDSNDNVSCSSSSGTATSPEPAEGARGPRLLDEETAFSFEELTDGDGLRWGDEIVGLSAEAAAEFSPRDRRPCASCGRKVVGANAEYSECSACLANAASKLGSGSAKDLMMRSLHDKLSSPERRKPSPSETKRRQVEKQATARLNREKIDLQRQAKLRMQSSRQEQVAKTKEEGILAQERAISERLERAAVAREAKLKSVAKKAENESLKVNEVQFINEMTEQEKTAQFHKKLEDGEKRRKEFIGTIRGKAEKQTERAQARRLREEDKERQLRMAMQKRHEDAEKRKAEALEEQRRRLDEMVIEASAKVTERRTEMEKEREAKLALIKEREERAEQERMKHLLAKRAVGTRSNTSSPSLVQQQQQQQPQQHEATSPPTFRPDAVMEDSEYGSSGVVTSLSHVSPGGAVASGSGAEFDTSESMSSEERRRRFAEEVSKSSQQMQIQEKQMKKKARKVKSKIAALCAEGRDELLAHARKASSSSAKKSPKVQNALEGLRSEAKVDSSLAKLVDALGEGNGSAQLCATAEEDLPFLFGLIACKDHFPKHPRRFSQVLEAISVACEREDALVDHLVAGNHVCSIVDLCVFLLRNPVDESNVSTLAHGLWILRMVLWHGASCDRTSAVLDRIKVDIMRHCLFSSLMLRIGERCAQIKCGRRWMGCGCCPNVPSPRNAASAACPDGLGCPHVGGALRLVRNSIGLLEVMTLLVLRHAEKEGVAPRDTPVGHAFLESAESSTLFRVVSQLVAAYIAVEGLHDSKPTSSGKAPVASQASQHKAMLNAAALAGLRALNLLACVSLELVQGILGSPALPFELQQLFRYVLNSCAEDGGSGGEMPGPPDVDWAEASMQPCLAGGESTASAVDLFAELVVLLGFYAVGNETNQESLNWGRSPTPLTRLCSVPFSYFTSPNGKAVLFPTLLSICCNNTRAVNIVAEEISPKLLLNFLATRARAVQDNGIAEHANQAKRFPSCKWQAATTFLLQCNE